MTAIQAPPGRPTNVSEGLSNGAFREEEPSVRIPPPSAAHLSFMSGSPSGSNLLTECQNGGPLTDVTDVWTPERQYGFATNRRVTLTPYLHRVPPNYAEHFDHNCETRGIVVAAPH